MRSRSETKSPAAAGLLLFMLVSSLLAAGCAERPTIGIEITNAPRPHGDCIPGSATRPCP